MSTPSVGASSTSTRIPTFSQRPSSIFCWLPPDSSRTAWRRLGVLTRRRATISAASRRRRPGRSSIERCAARRPIPTLSTTSRSASTPSYLRSSGRKAIPWRMAWRGLRRRAPPASRTSPASGCSMPATQRASSRRPEPMPPVTARISPARTRRPTPRSPGFLWASTTSRIVSDGGLSRWATSSVSGLWPSSSSTSRSMSRPSSGCVVTWRPSRRTVTVSASSKISSRWCET